MAQSSVLLDEASVPDRESKILESCSLLIEIGFSSEMFTLKNIHDHGYNDEDFFELIRPIHLFKDLDELSHLTAPVPKSDFVKFVDHMKWLTTCEGMNALSDSLSRLSRKNRSLSDQHVVLAQKLVSYTAPNRVSRKTTLKEINHLEKRWSQKKKDYFDINDDLKMKLGPLYDYEELSIHELRIESHKLYVKACESSGRSAVPIYRENGFETAIREFGDIAKKNHLLRFLHDPNRQEKIELYLKERLQWFDHVAAPADPQDSGESSKTLVADTDESVEHVTTKAGVSSKPHQSPNSKKAEASERKSGQPDVFKNVSDELTPKDAHTEVSNEVSGKQHHQDSKRTPSGDENKLATAEQEEEMSTKRKRKRKSEEEKHAVQGDGSKITSGDEHAEQKDKPIPLQGPLKRLKKKKKKGKPKTGNPEVQEEGSKRTEPTAAQQEEEPSPKKHRKKSKKEK